MDSVEKLDMVFGSLSGAAMDMASQWYSDSTLTSVFSKFKDPVKYPGQRVGIDVTDDIVSKFSTSASRNYAASSHPIRNSLHRRTGGIIKSATARNAEIAKEHALRAAGRSMTADGTIKGIGQLAEVDATRVRNALKFRKMSIGITGVWAMGMGASLASGVVSAAREKGANEIGKRWSMTNEGFTDSQMAYTTRQRGLRAIQSSQSGHRRAFGNEATFLHTMR